MKSIAIFVTVVLVIIAVPAAGQTTGFIEEQSVFAGGESSHALHATLNHQLTTAVLPTTFGVWAWAQASTGYGQLYAGPYVDLGAHLQFGIAAGWETSSNEVRKAAYVWAGKDKWSVYAIGETGGSGPWYRAIGGYQATQNLKVSVMTQRGLGVGPRVDLSIKPFAVWGAVLMNAGHSTTFIGVQIPF